MKFYLKYFIKLFKKMNNVNVKESKRMTTCKPVQTLFALTKFYKMFY